MNKATRARMTMTVKLRVLCVSAHQHSARARKYSNTAQRTKAPLRPIYAAASRLSRNAPLSAAAPDTTQQLCKDSINGGPGTGHRVATARARTSSEPQVAILAQYIKDLSVENPSAPQVFSVAGPAELDVQFNINVEGAGDDVHEVALKIDVSARSDNGVHFVVDLSYAGLFGLRNVPEEALQPFLLIEAPRLLFPFARQIIAEAVSNTGFPPLLLDPIDFAAAYMAQLAGASSRRRRRSGRATPSCRRRRRRGLTPRAADLSNEPRPVAGFGRRADPGQPDRSALVRDMLQAQLSSARASHPTPSSSPSGCPTCSARLFARRRLLGGVRPDVQPQGRRRR